jgi:hypothetical protein
MKVFADGAFYGKQPRFSRTPDDVILTVGGKPEMAAASDLVRYTLSLPGVSCAIIGTGYIDRKKPESDQMVANLTAAMKDIPSEIERRRIEEDAKAKHGAATNYFQEKTAGLIQPSNIRTRRDSDRVVIEWDTAFAGPEPIRSYNVLAGTRVLASLPFRPQLTEAPLSISIPAKEAGEGALTVVASEKLPGRPAV